MLISLTYLSNATRSFGDTELRELLETSRRNNRAAGLTGMLLYADGHFIQTLEGEAGAVEAKFDQICADPRHDSVIEALRDPIEERVFPDWSMGFESLSAEEAASIEGFSDYLDTGSALYQDSRRLGRAGIFHRIFRDDMRKRVVDR